MKPFKDSKVAAVFDAYPRNIRAKLMFLRQLIFDVASETEGVGELEETLKWGQPSYLTTKSKSGTTVRIDGNQQGSYAMYFHCQTNLIDSFKTIFPNVFTYDGNRAILFNKEDVIPVKELSLCVSLALTYHRNKKPKNESRSKTKCT